MDVEPHSPRLVLVTALPWERRALLRAWPRPRRIRGAPFPTWVREPWADLMLVQSGIGQVRAAACGAWCVAATSQATLVSLGCAGGLAPDLPAVAAIVGTEILGHRLPSTCDPAGTDALFRAAAETSGPVVLGSILSVDAPLASREEKRSAWIEHGAHAVDMESAALAACARDADRRFAAGRVILDHAEIDVRRGGGAAVAADVLDAVAARLTAWLSRLTSHPTPC